MLSAAEFGIINFHNGPLPLYGGVNIPSWAILNGEKRHGVSWHYIDERIDTGDILAQKIFEIPESITAAGLLARCINEGISLFQQECENILTGKISRKKQTGSRTYYSKKDLPENNGVVNLNWSFEKINRFVRGLNLFPFENKLCYPKIELTKDISIIPFEIEHLRSSDSYKGSDYFQFDENNETEVICADSVFRIVQMTDANFNFISPKELTTRLNSKL